MGELHEIRRIWLNEKHEFDDRLPEICREVTEEEFPAREGSSSPWRRRTGRCWRRSAATLNGLVRKPGLWRMAGMGVFQARRAGILIGPGVSPGVAHGRAGSHPGP